MARRVFSGRTIRSGARTRSMVWLDLWFSTDKVAVAASSAILLATFNAAALALRPFTIVRTRGTLWVASDQSGATEEPQIAFGMMMVNDTAAALGITAIPDPISGSDSPWFVYESAIPGVQVATSIGFNNPVGTQVTIDSKAQRKIGPNEDVAVVVANNSAADGASILLGGRQLVKLH